MKGPHGSLLLLAPAGGASGPVKGILLPLGSLAGLHGFQGEGIFAVFTAHLLVFRSKFQRCPTTGTFIFGYMQGRVLLSMGMWKAVPPGASDAAAAAAKGPPTGRRRCLQWAGPVECPKFRSIGAEAVPPGSERFLDGQYPESKPGRPSPWSASSCC